MEIEYILNNTSILLEAIGKLCDHSLKASHVFAVV